MKVTVDDKGNITITGKVGEDGGPYLSKSGKSVLLLSSGGNVQTEATYNDHPVSVNVNVMVPNPDAPKAEGATEKVPKKKVSLK